jgi:hypothetical protein
VYLVEWPLDRTPVPVPDATGGPNEQPEAPGAPVDEAETLTPSERIGTDPESRLGD